MTESRMRVYDKNELLNLLVDYLDEKSKPTAAEEELNLTAVRGDR